MLNRLEIKNYALIEKLELTPGDGLTIITGETGAGKSIIMGALSLLMGERADAGVLADKREKAVAEAAFSFPDQELKDVFERYEIEWCAEEVILRREVAASGRSRAFVNDQPVTLAVISDISHRLLNIHSQHSNAAIADPMRRLQMIDAMSDFNGLLDDYKSKFNRYVELRQQLRQLYDEIEDNKRNREMLLFQKEQLDKLKPRKGELAEIEKRFEMLSDADEIRDRLGEALALLGGNETACLERLGELRNVVSKIDLSVFGNNDQTDGISDRIRECYVELKDISSTLESCLGKVDADPAALARMSARMNLYYENMKSFRLTDADILVDTYEDIKRRLGSISAGGEDLSGLEAETKACGRELKELADRVSEVRRKGAAAFSSLVEEAARPLGLRNLDFEVWLQTGKLTSHGQDRVEFMCSFNKNQPLSPVSKTASGGEISRLLLAIEDILSTRMKLPTVIFDEIDTGVSGEIAGRMGDMMHQMGERMQVITITHLPQVAAYGDSHYKVYKEDVENRTLSRMALLDNPGRVAEIAGMLAGSSVNDAALENARVLLDERSRNVNLHNDDGKN